MSRPVKVVVVTTHIAPAIGFGGIAECAGRIAHAWAGENRDFALCASDASYGPALRPADLGLPPRISVSLFPAGRWPRFAFGLAGIRAVFDACRAADIVYVSGIGTWPTTVATLVCAILGRPMLVGLHAGLMRTHLAVIRARKPHKWLFYQLLTLPTLRRARCLHATSALEADGLDELLPGVPVVIIPNGLDLSDWPARPPRAADGGLTMCYVGRLSPEKGILRFMHIWRRVRGPNDRLLIAGSGVGSYTEAVAAEAEAAAGTIELAGTLDRAGVQAMLARSDLLVLPSGIENNDLRENFGNAAAEALASARPILVTRGLAWDEAEPGGFGLLFDPTDDGIAAAIAQARALTPDQLAAMGARGRAWAERSVDIQTTAECLWHHLVTRATAP